MQFASIFQCGSAHHRHMESDHSRVFLGDLVPSVCMPEDAQGGVVPEHPRQAALGAVGAVRHDDAAAVLAVAHAHTAAVMDGDPGSASATAVMALRKGQSETASEPSFMASVSRLGLATEPLSRWSRSMTMGAFTLPVRTSSLNFSPARCRSPAPIQQMRAGRPWKASVEAVDQTRADQPEFIGFFNSRTGYIREHEGPHSMR